MLEYVITFYYLNTIMLIDKEILRAVNFKQTFFFPLRISAETLFNTVRKITIRMNASKILSVKESVIKKHLTK